MPRQSLSELAECRECMCLALRTSARRITHRYDVALSGIGLRATQFSLLVMVHHLGAPRMKTLARMLNSDPTTITRNVQALEKRRLLSLARVQDLRERRLRLTKHGESILLRALPNWRKAQNEVVGSLTPAELTGLRGLLQQVGVRRKNVDGGKR